ncbi:hypothetical protein FEK35_13025 [Nocardia cyriacigeorgica]|uniref:XRE family transcriptional regulator n=1 Tax=Nocardia cyriacigeorgica TaxID=135487 RepID=A0A5R8PEN2_9NOCA|nr:hypothetical protein [Nocardia cyriacigeorgica]TLG10840.1 hypothetical protein FEK35_13025 [Nocardia cyriacigeorgica]
MIRGREWTGFEAAALQEAMRHSVREFAALLGVETTTVANWRSGLGTVIPRPRTQAILDTAYQQRTTPEDRERFDQIVGEGEEVWRKRHTTGGTIATAEKPAAGFETAHSNGHNGVYRGLGGSRASRPDDSISRRPPAHGGDPTNRRQTLRAMGIGGVSLAVGRENSVLNAAHESVQFVSATDRWPVDSVILRDASEEVHRLATHYAVDPDLPRNFVQLIALRDQLATAIQRVGRIADLSDLYVLFAATCTLLASVSHDLAEPDAGLMQTRAAGRFAELAGHNSLRAWVHCTRAMITSWWRGPDQVLREVAKAGAVSGISHVRLAGLTARAHAQLGNRPAALAAMDTARRERDRLSTPDSLTDLGPIFDFSMARQHYYDASTFAHLGLWSDVQREAEAVIKTYSPSRMTTWPVTLTLAQIHLAHARLHADGTREALETLQPVLALPADQRIPQVASALGRVRTAVDSGSDSAAERALAEAIDDFVSVTAHPGSRY